MTDLRALCARMADELDHCHQLLSDDRRELHPLAVEARAALAQPEPEVVASDEELLKVAEQAAHIDDIFDSLEECYPLELTPVDILEICRAVLSRHGRPAQAPAGEVGELVSLLRAEAADDEIEDHMLWMTPADARRAAALLERQATACAICERERLHQSTRAADLEVERQVAPVPVAVSERLPGPKDCAPWPDEPDASAWCWVGSDVDGGWSWEQRSAGCLAVFPDDYTHWLPAHALPLPSGEVGE